MNSVINVDAVPSNPSVSTQQPSRNLKTDEPIQNARKADHIVLDYLRKRGYKQAEEAFLAHHLPSKTPPAPVDIALNEAEVDDDLRNVIMMLSKPQDMANIDVRRYEESYKEFRDWVDGSLDIYKAELHSVLYPFLVHSFLEMVRREHWREAREFLQRCSAEFKDHSGDGGSSRRQEIISLSGISSAQHLEENEVAKLFRSNRYEIHLTNYAFSLIVSFLVDDPRRLVLLRILNQRCRVKVDESFDSATGKGSSGMKDGNEQLDDDKEGGFLQIAEKKALLKTDLLWGRLKPEQYIIPDESEDQSSKGGAKSKKKGALETGKSIDGKPKTDGTKKDGQNTEDIEKPHTQEDGMISESRVPLKKHRLGADALDSTTDRKYRAELTVATGDETCSNFAALCYTFTNSKDDGLNCCSISSDGSQIVAGFGDSSVRLWDAKASGTTGSDTGGLNGYAIRLYGHNGPVYSVEWTPCSKFILSGSEDGTIRLWSGQLKRDIAVYRGHNYPIWSVSSCSLGHYFASGSHDRSARIWSTDRIYPLRILGGHLADVDVVRWHPNCNYIATGSSDRSARLWDVREGNCVRVFGRQSGTVNALAFSPDGQTLACGGDGGIVDIWDIRMAKRMYRLNGHQGTIWSLDYSKEGAILASGGSDCKICLWRASNWCSIKTSTQEELEVTRAAIGTSNQNEKDEEKKESIANGMNGDEKTNKETKEKNTDKDGDIEMSGTNTNKANGKSGDETTEKNSNKDTMDIDGKEEQVNGNENKTEGDEDKEIEEEGDKKKTNGSLLVKKLKTKDTPIHVLRFNRRNVLMVAGCFRN